MSKYIGTPVVSLSTDTVDVTGDITTTDATPEVIIVNDTHEDTDGGREGKVTFKGQASGGEETTLAQIQGSHDGTSDDEKGDLIFRTNDGADGASPTEAMRIDSAQNVGIGTAAPVRNFHLHEAASSTPVVLAMSTNGTGATTGDGFNISIDGSSGAVNLIQRENAAMQFYTNGGTNERMRIADDGKVGIGTAAPLRQLSIASTASAEISFISGTSSNASLLFGDGTTGVNVYRGYIQYEHANDAMTFATVSAERMRIASNGDAMIAKAAVNTDTVGIELRSNGLLASTRDGGQPLFLNRLSSDGTVVSFAQTGSTKGTITVSGSSTAYNTSSDYRLKENVDYTWDATTRLKQLKPARFNFIADADTTVDGFLAHEAATVVPEAIYGTKDEVEVWKDGDELPDGVSVGDSKLDDNGKTIPVMQGIDQSKLVPLLVKTILELEARITALEGE